MSDILAIVPAQLLLEVEQFISHHRGVTFAEAESAVMSLRKYRVEGTSEHQQQIDRIAKLEEEVKSLHEKIVEMTKAENGQ